MTNTKNTSRAKPPILGGDLCKILALKFRHPELVEGSVQPAFLRATELILRQAQDDRSSRKRLSQGSLGGIALLCFITAFCLAACSSGKPVQEGEYYGGMPVDTATVEPMPGGGYKTISGDPLVAVNGGIEQESMLPYGGGDQGIRQMEDETPFYSTN